MKFDKYKPSRAEVQKAEESLTEEQAALREERYAEFTERERQDLERRFLGNLQSGERLFDLKQSHMHNVEIVKAHLPHILSTIESNGNTFIKHIADTGEIIGTTACVATTDTDEIVYAQRVERRGLTRFVKNKEPEPTSNITVVMTKIPEGFLLLTAYVGNGAPVEPWDPKADEAAQAFWNSHALVWGSEPIVPGTETTTPAQ